MRALVVYESMFGTTRDIAEAIAEGLSSTMSVTVTEVGAAPKEVPADIGLLVVGGPTHAFGMSRPSTREDAAKQTATLVSTGIGIREWLAEAEIDASVPVAVFDTRVDRPRLPGSAAAAAAKRLRRRGRRITAKASFYVTGREGGPVDGELGRARWWGRVIAPEPRRTAAAV